MVLLRSLRMARTLLVGSFLSDLMRLGSGTDELNGTPGDILIGADGIHSKVREHVLGPSAPTPTYIGSCTMSGFLPVDSITAPCGFNFPAMIFTPIGLIMAMAILIDPEGKTIAKGREGWREYEVSGEAARVAKAEHADCTTEPIRSLLGKTSLSGFGRPTRFPSCQHGISVEYVSSGMQLTPYPSTDKAQPKPWGRSTHDSPTQFKIKQLHRATRSYLPISRESGGSGSSASGSFRRKVDRSNLPARDRGRGGSRNGCFGRSLLGIDLSLGLLGSSHTMSRPRASRSK